MAEITGYRELTDIEIAHINLLKREAQGIGNLIDALASNSLYDQRWMSIARTELQQGFMAAVRAIARPEGF